MLAISSKPCDAFWEQLHIYLNVKLSDFITFQSKMVMDLINIFEANAAMIAAKTVDIVAKVMGWPYTVS